MRRINLRAMKWVSGLHFSPDGRKLLAVGGTRVSPVQRAEWVDLSNQLRLPSIPLNAKCYAVSPDLKRMALGGAQGGSDDVGLPAVVAFDPRDPTWGADSSRYQTIMPKGERWCQVDKLAFSIDGVQLAIDHRLSWFTDGSHRSESRIRFANVEDGWSRWFTWRGDCIQGMAFTPDGTVLAVVWGDWNVDVPPRVGVFTTGTFQSLRTIPLPAAGGTCLAYSPDGGTLAVASYCAVVLLVADSEEPRLTLAHPKQANAVAFTPDGGRVLSTCDDGLLRIWDVATGQLITSYDWGIGQTTAVAVAPDGLTAAVAGKRGQIAIFDLG